MKWMKLTKVDGKPVYLHMSEAMSVAPVRGRTVIGFAGGADDIVEVQEAPEDILRALGVSVLEVTQAR